MSSKGNVKFKFRIVISNDSDWPYKIQKKGWFFWHELGQVRSRGDADDEIHKLAKLELMKPGSTVREYTEQDFLVDKLKGTV